MRIIPTGNRPPLFPNIQNRPAMDNTLRIAAKLESWDTIRTFVLERVEQRDVDQDIAFKIELALEELVVNVINYAYPQSGGDLEIGCALEASSGLCISIRDWGRPFNPLERESPDLAPDISERAVGGLGVFLVRQVADDVEYIPMEDGNMLIVRFRM